MKKLLALMLAVMMIVALAVPSASAAKDTFTIDVALHSTDTISEEAVDMFKEAVEKGSEGKITVNVFKGGELGTEAENITQLSTGEINCALLGSLYPEQVLPEYNVTGIPFAFPSEEAVEEYWNGEIGKTMEGLSIERADIKLAGLVSRGARQLTSNKEIAHPEEVAGLKLRLPENATWVTVWKSLGAQATPVNWNETYTALQTNVVDAQENPIATYYANNIQEVQSVTTLTNHIYNHYYWCYNESFLESMPEELQELVLTETANACAWAKQAIIDKTAEYKEALEEAGHTFIEIDPAEWAAAAKDGIMEAAKVSCDDAKAVLAQYVG